MEFGLNSEILRHYFGRRVVLSFKTMFKSDGRTDGVDALDTCVSKNCTFENMGRP